MLQGPSGRGNKRFWTEFFQILQENPCLWDTTSPLFHKQTIKILALNVLLEKYWEIDSSATTETVKKKLQIFRSGFSREHRKKTIAALNGSSYTSTLWYYNYMTFLKDNGQDEEKIQEWERNECSDNVIELTHGTVVFNDRENISTEPDASSPEPAAVSNLPTISRVKSIAELQQTAQQPGIYAVPTSSMIDQGINNNLDETEEDDCSTFAAHVKMRMRNFAPSQKVIAQKLISDVLFMADTQQLQIYSSVVNPITHQLIPIGPVSISKGTLTPMVPAASACSVTPVNMTTVSMASSLPATKAPAPKRTNNGAIKTTQPIGGSFVIDIDDDDQPLAKKNDTNEGSH